MRELMPGPDRTWAKNTKGETQLDGKVLQPGMHLASFRSELWPRFLLEALPNIPWLICSPPTPASPREPQGRPRTCEAPEQTGTQQGSRSRGESDGIPRPFLPGCGTLLWSWQLGAGCGGSRPREFCKRPSSWTRSEADELCP